MMSVWGERGGILSVMWGERGGILSVMWGDRGSRDIDMIMITIIYDTISLL